MMTVTRALIAIVALCAIPALAQDQPPPVRKVSLRMLQLEGEPEPLFFRNKDEWNRCHVSRRRISPPVETRVVGNQLAFYKEAGPVDETGKPVEKPLGTVALPPEGKQFLLLVFQAQGKGAGIKVVALPRDDLSGESGQTILYNFSSYPVVGETSGERFSLRQGERAVLSPEANKNNNLSLRLARFAQEDWKVAFSTVWGSNPNLNTLFFIYDAPTGKNAIDVKRFQDSPIPASTSDGVEGKRM